MKAIKITTLRTIITLAVINSLLYIVFGDAVLSNDSSGYEKAWDVLLLGNIDKFRTPAYPIFLGLIKSVVHEHYFYLATIILQHFIFLLSIPCFYKLVYQISSHKNLAWIISLFYAIYPGITSWNSIILTESLALSCNVFLVYNAYIAWTRNSMQSCLYFSFFLLLAIFIRPASIYAIPVCAVAWIIAFLKQKDKRRLFYAGMAGIITSSIALFAYTKAFESRYGTFSPTAVSTINQYYLARQYGMLTSKNSENQHIKTYIENTAEKGDDLWSETLGLMNNFELKDIQKEVSNSYKKNFAAYFNGTAKSVFHNSNCTLFSTYYGSTIGVITAFTSLDMKFLYLLILCYTFVLFYHIIFKKHRIPWFSCFIYMLGCSHLIVIILGAQQEWSRLLLPAIPIYMLMFGQLFNFIAISCTPKHLQSKSLI